MKKRWAKWGTTKTAPGVLAGGSENLAERVERVGLGGVGEFEARVRHAAVERGTRRHVFAERTPALGRACDGTLFKSN